MKHDSFALALVVLLFASDCLPSKGLSPQLTGSTGSIGMAFGGVGGADGGLSVGKYVRAKRGLVTSPNDWSIIYVVMMTVD